MFNSMGGSPPSSALRQITVTRAVAISTQTAGTLAAGAWYRITGCVAIGAGSGDVWLYAVEADKLSSAGYCATPDGFRSFCIYDLTNDLYKQVKDWRDNEVHGHANVLAFPWTNVNNVRANYVGLRANLSSFIWPSTATTICENNRFENGTITLNATGFPAGRTLARNRFSGAVLTLTLGATSTADIVDNVVEGGASFEATSPTAAISNNYVGEGATFALTIAAANIQITANRLYGQATVTFSVTALASSVFTGNVIYGSAIIALSAAGGTINFTNNTVRDAANVTLFRGAISQCEFKENAIASFSTAATTLVFTSNVLLGRISLSINAGVPTGLIRHNIFGTATNAVAAFTLAIGCSNVAGEIIGNKLFPAGSGQLITMNGATAQFNFNDFLATFMNCIGITGQVLRNRMMNNSTFNLSAFAGLFSDNVIEAGCSVTHNAATALGQITNNALTGNSTLTCINLAAGGRIQYNRLESQSSLAIVCSAASAPIVQRNRIIGSTVAIGAAGNTINGALRNNDISSATLAIATFTGASSAGGSLIDNNLIHAAAILNIGTLSAVALNQPINGNRISGVTTVDVTAAVQVTNNIIANANQTLAVATLNTRLGD
jgi:hypothetical protein